MCGCGVLNKWTRIADDGWNSDRNVDEGSIQDVINFGIASILHLRAGVRMMFLGIHFHGELLRRSSEKLLPGSVIESIYGLER